MSWTPPVSLPSRTFVDRRGYVSAITPVRTALRIYSSGNDDMAAAAYEATGLALPPGSAETAFVVNRDAPRIEDLAEEIVFDGIKAQIGSSSWGRMIVRPFSDCGSWSKSNSYRCVSYPAAKMPADDPEFPYAQGLNLRGAHRGSLAVISVAAVATTTIRLNEMGSSYTPTRGP